MKTILFYWSRGADTRRKLMRIIGKCERKKEPCYINQLAKSLKLSHVAIKKHLSLLLDNDYVTIINPQGKPQYLILTDKGKNILSELSEKE